MGKRFYRELPPDLLDGILDDLWGDVGADSLYNSGVKYNDGLNETCKVGAWLMGDVCTSTSSGYNTGASANKSINTGAGTYARVGGSYNANSRASGGVYAGASARTVANVRTDNGADIRANGSITAGSGAGVRTSATANASAGSRTGATTGVSGGSRTGANRGTGVGSSGGLKAGAGKGADADTVANLGFDAQQIDLKEDVFASPKVPEDMKIWGNILLYLKQTGDNILCAICEMVDSCRVTGNVLELYMHTNEFDDKQMCNKLSAIVKKVANLHLRIFKTIKREHAYTKDVEYLTQKFGKKIKVI